jgi:alkaline phosphatase D
MSMSEFRADRRGFIVRGGLIVAATACHASAPGLLRARLPARADRPVLEQGIAFGDVQGDRAIVWARADRPARLHVTWDTTERFDDPRSVLGPYALEDSDFTARLDLTQLPPDQRIFVRVAFQSLNNDRAWSEPVLGSFLSAPSQCSDIRFVWTGDTAGQGFGINPDFGAAVLRRRDYLRRRSDTHGGAARHRRQRVVHANARSDSYLNKTVRPSAAAWAFAVADAVDLDAGAS